jgi:hypothetical protein
MADRDAQIVAQDEKARKCPLLRARVPIGYSPCGPIVPILVAVGVSGTPQIAFGPCQRASCPTGREYHAVSANCGLRRPAWQSGLSIHSVG